MRLTRVSLVPFHCAPPRDPRSDCFWVCAIAALSAIACDSVSSVETGAIEVTSSTTGGAPDPDGYTVSLDAVAGQPIGLNASLTFSDVPPGQHTVELSGLASNCTVTGSNPEPVTVAANATAQISFTVTCVSGSIEITTATSGTAPDPDGYTVSIDAAAGQPIGINASLTLPDVAPGQHTVVLAGLASNCTVTGSNPEPVTVVANATAQIIFTVTCVSGSIEITTATSGTAPDPDGYTVSLDAAAGQPIGINASLTLSDVAAGQHTVELSGLASNCTVTGSSNPKPVTVVANTTTQVSLVVTCGSSGRIRVTVSTTGANIPLIFLVDIDSSPPPGLLISPNGSVTSQPLSVGSHSVRLAVTVNCSVTGSNPQTVTVTGVTTQVNFTAVCH